MHMDELVNEARNTAASTDRVLRQPTIASRAAKAIKAFARAPLRKPVEVAYGQVRLHNV